MLHLMWPWTSSSSVVGGGVHGKGTGIAHGITAQVGAIIMVFPLFMGEYLVDGEMNIGSIVGMAENGIMNEYLTLNFNRCIKGMFMKMPDSHGLK